MPLVAPVVFQEKDAGTVAVEPANKPSRYHSTLVTPTLSEAFTFTVIMPETVVPSKGAVTVTEGRVVSGAGFWMVTLTDEEVPVLPAAS